MLLTSAILLIPLLAYSTQVIGWYLQWIQSDEFKAEHNGNQGLSVIIPFKDEAPNLPALLASLQKQTYDKWELILVNDQSSDNGLDIIHELLTTFTHPVRIINSKQAGKKAALLEGVQQAQYDLIVTTDADCTFHAEWLSSLSSYYTKHQPDLLFGPVGIIKKKGVLQRFQQVDFTALQVSGAAAALQQKPIMCNGANLMCNKTLYLQAHIQPAIASGDDMFLLEWMKQHNKSVQFIRSTKALVETQSCNGFKAFLQQRARWAAKAPHYKDRQIIFSGIVVTLVNVVLLSSLIVGFFIPQLLNVFGISILIKSLVDYMLIKAGSYDYKLRITLFEIVFWQLVYPFYVITVLLFPLFYTLQWKNRSI